jgi:hypothetical protein
LTGKVTATLGAGSPACLRTLRRGIATRSCSGHPSGLLLSVIISCPGVADVCPSLDLLMRLTRAKRLVLGNSSNEPTQGTRIALPRSRLMPSSQMCFPEVSNMGAVAALSSAEAGAAHSSQYWHQQTDAVSSGHPRFAFRCALDSEMSHPVPNPARESAP